jgi:hypothetical protein
MPVLLNDEENHSFWIGELYTTFENKLCNTETINESPFSIFISKSPILLSQLYYTVQYHMTVYRGLNIPKG